MDENINNFKTIQIKDLRYNQKNNDIGLLVAYSKMV